MLDHGLYALHGEIALPALYAPGGHQYQFADPLGLGQRHPQCHCAPQGVSHQRHPGQVQGIEQGGEALDEKIKGVINIGGFIGPAITPLVIDQAAEAAGLETGDVVLEITPATGPRSRAMNKNDHAPLAALGGMVGVVQGQAPGCVEKLGLGRVGWHQTKTSWFSTPSCIAPRFLANPVGLLAT